MDPFALVDWCYEDGRTCSIGRTKTAARQQLALARRSKFFLQIVPNTSKYTSQIFPNHPNTSQNIQIHRDTKSQYQYTTQRLYPSTEFSLIPQVAAKPLFGFRDQILCGFAGTCTQSGNTVAKRCPTLAMAVVTRSTFRRIRHAAAIIHKQKQRARNFEYFRMPKDKTVVESC